METAWDVRLRTAGLRVTRPRLAVLDVLAGHPHTDADSITAAARTAHPSLSRQAVYGVLKALVADVDCAVGAAPCLTPSGAAGFAVDEAEVVFWGRCADCQVGRGKLGYRSPGARGKSRAIGEEMQA
jgi:Fur family ferric uptake transcriptional regulator